MIFEILKNQIEKSRRYISSIGINAIFISLVIYVRYSLYCLLNDHTLGKEYIFFYTVLSLSLVQTLATTRIPLFCKELKKGTLVKYYKYPISLYKQFVYEEIGESFFSLVGISLFIIAVLVALSVQQNILYSILFICAVLLYELLAIMISILLFSLSFIFMSEKCSKALLTCISDLLSGSMIPLLMLPKWFERFCYYTPFPYLIDAPISILLNKAPALNILVLQFIWIIILYIAGTIVLNLVTKRVTIYGG